MPFERWFYVWRVRLRMLIDRDRVDRDLGRRAAAPRRPRDRSANRAGDPGGRGAPAGARDLGWARVGPERGARGAVRGGARADRAGLEIRVAQPFEIAGLRAGGRRDRGPRHRRVDGGVQRRGCSAVESVAVPTCRTDRDGLAIRRHGGRGARGLARQLPRVA